MRMQKLLILVLVVSIVVAVGVGCGEKEEEDDPRWDEVVNYLIIGDYDTARTKAKTLYANDKEEMQRILEFIDEREQSDMDINPEKKLVIQPGYTNKIEDGYIIIEGRVKNISNDTNDAISYFEIRVDFYSENEEHLHSTYINDGLDLLPGQQREFTIREKYQDEYSKFKLSIGDVR